ncbi:MAG: hypothetical protein ABSG61_03290 [Gemmatimonadales bacterium]|jgi:hypothetical protein
MLGIVLVASLAALPAPPPQDTGTVDAPVYENATFGVSVPRPFADWVFEPGAGRRTATVIFHPKRASLSDQLWGALILTSYPGRATLAQVAEQRLQVAWRSQLGGSLVMLARDSLRLAGYPAMHFALSGTIGHVEIRAEEYVIARRRELVVLQFRYPRAVPYDSIAAGYRRVLDGLRIDGAPAAAAPLPPAATENPAPPRALPWSPWQARSYSAVVRYDSARVRADFAVRMDLVNDGPVPADSAAVWLWPGFALDSVRAAAATLRPNGANGVSLLALRDAVQPQAGTAVTFFYHLGAEAVALPPERGGFAPDAAYLAFDWLPRAQSAADTSAQVARTARARYTLGFDVPDTWRAIAPGRLTAEVASLGRRRMTWVTEDVAATTPAFALGPYRIVTRRSGGLGVAIWLAPDDSASTPTLDALVRSVRAAWIFCSRAFGRLPLADISVVSTRLPEMRGFLGLVLDGGLDSSRDLLYREVARSWWGNSVDAAGPGSWWVREGFPAWTSIAARGALEGDTVRQRLVREAERRWHATVLRDGDAPLSSLAPDAPGAELLRSKGAAALEATRRAAGETAFREAMLSLALEHRNGWLTLEAILDAFGPDARTVLRTYLY